MAESNAELKVSIDALEKQIATRLDAMDRAVSLLQAFADRHPTIAVVDANLAALAKLTDERFAAIQMQLSEREKRTNQIQSDSKVALAAALDSQERSTAKSEGNFTKQIDTLAGQLHLMNKNMDDKIGDLKDRFNGMTGTQRKTEGRTEGMNFVWAAIGAVVGLLIPIAGIAMSLFAK